MVKNLLLGVIVIEKILSLYVESSQNMAWGKKAARDYCYIVIFYVQGSQGKSTYNLYTPHMQ